MPWIIVGRFLFIMHIHSIMTTIKQEEAKLCQEQEEDKWPWIRELITVLVYYEILKRRNKKKKYYLF